MSSSPTESSTSTLVEVVMPQMGVSVAEGIVVEWKKAVGERVALYETIVEISTDKVDVEVPSPAGGCVSEILVAHGGVVAVGTVIARIDTAGVHDQPESPATFDRADPVPPVSPVVARIAAERGLDLSEVSGSGRGGRITKQDVLSEVERHAPAPDCVAAASQPGRSAYSADEPADGAKEHSEQSRSDGGLTIMRRQIGEHMLRSLRTAAHCTTISEADLSGVERVRGSLSYLPFVARSVVEALGEHPRLNATIEDGALTEHRQVHLGIAVSLRDDGLIVPVVRDAQEFSHAGLAARIAELSQRARAGDLSPDEVCGGTFTITNPGRYGALIATPIINQPQVAILDLEAVVPRPVAVGPDAVAVRPMAYLCLSWDHRALDGVAAARFLAGVRDRLEGWDA